MISVMNDVGFYRNITEVFGVMASVTILFGGVFSMFSIWLQLSHVCYLASNFFRDTTGQTEREFDSLL